MEDDLLVISGDALTDIHLTDACAFHRRKGAAVTLVVTRVEDPREYGLVDYGEDGRITGFVEKPGWAQAVTDSANTGIYILSPEVLPYIPENMAFDFAKDLFPNYSRTGCPCMLMKRRTTGATSVIWQAMWLVRKTFLKAAYTPRCRLKTACAEWKKKTPVVIR